ncbi:MAG: LysR family transcriptional regulator [Sporolactobacillus sp.]
MEIKQLITFQKAAEQLNFTRTAEHLSFAQSSVTAHIKALEAEFGVPLFDRLGKHLKLTEAGETMKRYADRILALSAEAEKVITLDKEPSGVLVIGASESLCTYRLPPILSAFRHHYPKVRFHFFPGTSDEEIIQQLVKGKLDAAIVMDSGQTTDLLQIEKLKKERILLVAAMDNPLSALDKVEPKDIAKEALLLTEKGCNYRQNLDQMFTNHRINPAFISEFASVEAIKQCVLSGLGVAVLPEMTIKKELENGLMKMLPCAGYPMYIHSRLLRLRDRWVSPALAAFLQLTRSGLMDE